jgi:hypothetical protein
MARKNEPDGFTTAPQTLFAACKWSYAQASAFAVAFPWLFLIPAAVELLQHAAEIHIGFYDSADQMQATSDSVARMGFAHLKVLALFSLSYFVPRYLGNLTHRTAVVVRDPVALRLFGIVMVWNLFWVIVELDGPAVLGSLGLLSRSVSYAFLFLQLALTVLGVGLCAWGIAAALGNPAIGFRRSLVITSGSWLWSVALTVLVLLLPMVLHYLFAGLVIGRPRWIVWVTMIIDAPLSAYLGVLIATSEYAIAHRVTARNGLSLLAHSEVAVPEISHPNPTAGPPTVNSTLENWN